MKITLPYYRNPFVKQTIHADTENPDQFTLQVQEDLGGIIDYCKAKSEAMAKRAPDGLVHVAEVPLSIAEKAEQEGWDKATWRRWLNDPDNDCFRVWKGKV